MLNSVIMTGRMVADPELRTTQSGVNVTSFRIAVTRNYKVNDEYLSDFFTVVPGAIQRSLRQSILKRATA